MCPRTFLWERKRDVDVPPGTSLILSLPLASRQDILEEPCSTSCLSLLFFCRLHWTRSPHQRRGRDFHGLKCLSTVSADCVLTILQISPNVCELYVHAQLILALTCTTCVTVTAPSPSPPCARLPHRRQEWKITPGPVGQL